METKEMIKEKIGNRVKKIREEIMHMTKNQFAKLIGMKTQYLSTVENGKRGLTIQKVLIICEKCNISADYLLRGTKNYTDSVAIKKLSRYSNEEISIAFNILDDLISLLK